VLFRSGEDEFEYSGPYQYRNDPAGTYAAVSPAEGQVIVVALDDGESAGLLGSGRMIKVAPMIAGAGLIKSGRMIAN
jgi:hypothetical protein